MIRPATREDLDAIVAVHVAGFRLGNAPYLPEGERDRLTPERSAAGWGAMLDAAPGVASLVAEEGGAVVGVAAAGPTRDIEPGDSGELYVLYVDPDRWGAGHGTALDAAARAHLAGVGLAAAVLWVLEGNDRARRFYEARGWRADGERRTHAGAVAVRYRVVL